MNIPKDKRLARAIAKQWKGVRTWENQTGRAWVREMLEQAPTLARLLDELTRSVERPARTKRVRSSARTGSQP